MNIRGNDSKEAARYANQTSNKTVDVKKLTLEYMLYQATINCKFSISLSKIEYP